ncbi:MAG: DUF2254 domain-containing protein [Rhodopila sp.]|nr:DUF2254 domain-containing protein [Rhodopila sp.]
MLGFKQFSRVAQAVPGTNLVPVPYAIAAAVVVLLAATLVLDGLFGRPWVALPSRLSVGNVDDARAILGAILGAVSTVLALIFSVTLLVFSTAVSQFGPRLMPYFLRDRTMQVTIGLFLATFLHSLATFVVTGQRGDTTFVPHLTVLFSVALVFVSFGYLVIYNNQIAQAIQTNNVLARIIENLHAAISELARQHVIDTSNLDPAQPRQVEPLGAVRRRCTTEGSPVLAITSGYMQRIDHARLVRAADRHDVIVCLASWPGQFVLEGEVLAHVLPASGQADLAAAVHGSVIIGQHRTLQQDIEFAFAQLSEIAIRALSPAINDTYTGLSCIDWLGDALRMLVSYRASDDAWRAHRGQIRVLVPHVQFADIVRAGFDLIREAGASSPAVMIRMLQTYARLAPMLVDDGQRQAILAQVEAVRQSMQRLPEASLDREALDAAYLLAHKRLAVD